MPSGSQAMRLKMRATHFDVESIVFCFNANFAIRIIYGTVYVAFNDVRKVYLRATLNGEGHDDL